MTGRIPTTSPSNQQASPTESLSKQAKGEAKGKQILVLDEGGKFEVTSRKTGVGTSIKRLAVRVAVLFTSKDKSYWNKALGLDQDNRATRAAVEFTEKFNTKDDISVKVEKTHVAIDKLRLDKYIEKYNEAYPSLFIAHKLDGALDEMGVPKDDEIRQEAKKVATSIVQNTKFELRGQLLSKDEVAAKLNQYKQELAINIPNKFNVTRFIEHRLDGMLDEMGVPNDGGHRQKAKEIAATIVKNTGRDQASQLFEGDNAVDGIRDFQALLKSDQIEDLVENSENYADIQVANENVKDNGLFRNVLPNKINTALDRMEVSNEVMPRQAAIDMSKTIMNETELGSDKQKLTNGLMDAKFKEFGELLKSDQIEGLNIARQAVLAVASKNSSEFLVNEGAEDKDVEKQISLLKDVMKEIDGFLGKAPDGDKSSEFCTLMLKEALTTDQGGENGLTKKKGQVFATSFLHITSGSARSDHEIQISTALISKSSASELASYAILHNACQAVLGKQQG